MWRTIPTAFLGWLFLLGSAFGQDVFVPRELRPLQVTQPEKETEKAPPANEPVGKHAGGGKVSSITDPPASLRHPSKADAVKFPTVTALPPNPHTEKAGKTESTKASMEKEPPAKPRSQKARSVKIESDDSQVTKEPDPNVHPDKAKSAKAEPEKAPKIKEPTVDSDSEKVRSAKAEKSSKGKEPVVSSRSEKEKVKSTKAESEKVETAKVETEKASKVKDSATGSRSEKSQLAKTESVKAPASKEPTVSVRSEKTQTSKAAPGEESQEPIVDVQISNRSIETASTKLADGFDFPVGKPEAEGYYKARGFRSGGHVGEDWDGVRGGDTDLRDPIYCIGNGVVVFARDVRRGWGNVVIVRHAFREGGTVKHVDSLYGHLHTITVKRGQRIARGQQVGTMGTAHGRYDAHLHLEIRKNLEIGMSRAKFQKNFSNYYDPSQFIESHRRLSGGGESFRVAMNTFTHDAAFHFDDAPNGATRKHRSLISATR